MTRPNNSNNSTHSRTHNNNRPRALRCLAGLALLASAGASALEGAELYNLSLKDLLNTKVSIASRNATPLLSNPSSVSIFSRQDIDRLGLRTLAELLSLVPGFYSMMDSVEGNLSHLVMRGHAQNYANTLLVLLNGERINDDYTGGLNYLIRYFNIRNASKIEVIRGPGSALYGSNAYSGVINIITDGNRELGVEAGTLDTAALYWGDQTSAADWRLGASLNLYRDGGDTFDDVFDRAGLQTRTQDPRAVQQFSVYAKDDRSRIDLHYLRSKRDDYYLFRRLRDGVSQDELRHWMLYGSHQLLDRRDWTVKLSGGYQDGNRQSLTALTAAGEPPFTEADFLFGLDFEYRSANLALNAAYRMSDALTWNLGASISHSELPRSYLKSNYDLFGDERYLGGLVTFDADETQRTTLDRARHIRSAYLQNQWAITPALNLTTGLRLDAYNDIDNALTPRLSLVHALDQHQGYKLIYGRAYRAPSLGDLYDEESGLTVGNRSLKANKIASIEAAYYWHGDQHAWTATLFDNHHEDIVAPFNDGSLSFLANIGGNDARGLELEWQWQPSAHWQFKSAATHLFRNKTQVLPAAGLTPSEDIAPKSYLNFDLRYVADPWSLSVYGSWRNRVPALSDRASLWLLNARLRYFFSADLTGNLTVKNLTDRRYATSTYSPIGVDADGQTVQELPARGRQLTLELVYRR